MDTSQLYLLLAMLVFLGGFGYALWAIHVGAWTESRWHVPPMLLGFTLQTAFLMERGQFHGRCPLTSVPEVFAFISWSIVLLYFVVGTAYRLSLLGVFTAPMVTSLMIPAFVVPPVLKPLLVPQTFWEHLHAPLAMIAYAAFALACISGVMFLIQDSLLKKHKIVGLFYRLPPIHELSKAIVRMVAVGVTLCALMQLSTFKIETPISAFKLWVSWGVLAMYLVILGLMVRRSMSSRSTAWMAILAFILPLACLLIVSQSREY